MKKKLPAIVIGFVLIIGICVVLYPVVSAVITKMTQRTVITSYQQAVNKTSDADMEKMKTQAQEYNASLLNATLQDPFTDTEKLDESYDQLLSINGVLGFIEIPKIKVNLPIYYGSTEEVLKKGVGHLKNTSLPIGGEGTHAVLSGHRGLPSSTLFTDLDQLIIGDEFYIHVYDEILAYKVDQIKVVDPDDTEDLAIAHGKDYVTLVTCTPYGINTQRLLIRAERTEYTNNREDRQKISGNAYIVSTLFVIAAAIPIVLLVRKKRKGRK